MTRDSMMIFLKRILENGSQTKSAASLNQLKSILEMQNADKAMVELIEETIQSIPEAKAAAEDDAFTEDSLRIAIQRAKDRKHREEMMTYYGRC